MGHSCSRLFSDAHNWDLQAPPRETPKALLACVESKEKSQEQVAPGDQLR